MKTLRQQQQPQQLWRWCLLLLVLLLVLLLRLSSTTAATTSTPTDNHEEKEECGGGLSSSSSTATATATGDGEGVCIIRQEETEAEAEAEPEQGVVPDDCTLVWAPLHPKKMMMNHSHNDHDNGDWGVFTLVPRTRGDRILYGDIVIQLIDLEYHHNHSHVNHNKNYYEPIDRLRLLKHQVWNAQATGGHFEGQRGNVMSVVPGLAMMLLRHHHKKQRMHSDSSNHNTSMNQKNHHHNVLRLLPFVPQIDEGGLTRQTSPGAGAITHYHNYTFYIQSPTTMMIPAGSRVMMTRDMDPFLLYHKNKDNHNSDNNNNDDDVNHDHVLQWLKRHGMCLDNLQPIPRSRVVPHAGRAVVATRPIPKGGLVMPVPVLPLHRSVLFMHQNNHPHYPQKKQQQQQQQQLLLNYCMGHPNSSLLLFPYGPLVNLVNHYDEGTGTHAPNVALQWSAKINQTQWHAMSVQELLQHYNHDNDDHEHSSRWLLLELRAIRPIPAGEEVLLDYGPLWTQAWHQHTQAWHQQAAQANHNMDTHHKHYAPSYVHDDAIRSLRLESEIQQQNIPYPSNIFTACFYKYNQNHSASTTTTATTSNAKKNKDLTTTTVKWTASRGVFELRHLRPCRVLQRHHPSQTVQSKKDGPGTVFTVQMLNFNHHIQHHHHQHGHDDDDDDDSQYNNIIPKTAWPHIVSHVPRHAIRFSDVPYSTDQHLAYAFRHELHTVPYPPAWLDLDGSSSSLNEFESEIESY